MINFFKKILIFIILSLLIFVFLTNPNLIINSVNYSVNIFLTNVVPSLFPFFILADTLINYNYIYFLNKIFKFKYSHLILLSLFSGLPSNAKYINNLLENNDIDINDASIMLSVTFFPNPMFVIGSIGSLMLNSIKLGTIILLTIYLSNFIIYLINYKNLNKKNLNLTNKQNNFTTLIKTSVINNTKTLLIILGTIVIFTTLSNIIFNYIKIPTIYEGIITSIFEMTSGVKKISLVDTNIQYKIILISVFLSFSGISVLCQAFSILSNYKLNLKIIIKNKLLIILLTFLINYFYIIFWMWINTYI